MGKFIVPPPQPPPPHTNVSYRLWRLACKASTCPPLSIIVRWVRGWRWRWSLGGQWCGSGGGRWEKKVEKKAKLATGYRRN